MIKTSFYTRIEQIQLKLHGLSVGMTLGISSAFLGQGCPLLGHCPTCATCVPRLPLLALPLLADGLVVITAKLMKSRAMKEK